MTKPALIRRQKRLQQVSVWLVFAQVLAALAILFRFIMPPVIGFGWFSFAVDFRYLTAVLLGVSVANLVLLPFVFVWAHRSLRWRLSVCLPVLVLATFSNVAYPIVASAGGFQQVILRAPVREFWLLFTVVLVCVFGLTFFPLYIRAQKGWRVAKESDVLNELPLRDRHVDYVTLFVLLLLVFFIAPLAEGRAVGLCVLSGSVGLCLGGLIAVPAFWLMRDLSPSAFRIMFALVATVSVVVPVSCWWLTDILKAGFVGAGLWFLCAATAASVLLLHVLLFRGMGLRIRRLRFEKRVGEPAKKAVVDPFSD